MESQCWELTCNENLPCPGSEADLSSQRCRVVGRHTQRRAEPQQVRSVTFLTEVPPDIVVISWGLSWSVSPASCPEILRTLASPFIP